MKITLSKQEVEKIVLDYVNWKVNPSAEEGEDFNRVYLDSYGGYSSFATIEKVKEEEDGTGT